MTKQLVNLLKEESQFIFDNETSFIERFFKSWGWVCITNIWFNECGINVYFYNENGSYSDNIGLIDYYKWKESK